MKPKLINTIRLSSIRKRVGKGWDPILVLALVAAGLLLFYNLGQRPLWQDEAETACLAKNVLKYGTPIAFDGKNLISQEEGLEFGSTGYLWRWSPWLQIYLQALGFIIFGPGSTGARAPFAFAAWLTVLFTYLLVKKASGDLAWARISALLLSLSIPFIMFARQGRYYAVGALAAVLILYFYEDRFRDNYKWPTLLALAAVVLFYANFILFISYLAGLGLGALVLYRRETPWRKVFWSACLCGVLLIPGVLVSRMDRQAELFNLSGLWKGLVRYGSDYFLFFLPLPLVLYLAYFPIRAFRNRNKSLMSDSTSFVLFIGLITTVNIVILALAPFVFTRYLVHLFPLAAILAGWCVVKAFDYSRYSGALLFMLLAGTNFLNIIPLDVFGKVDRPWHATYNMLVCPDIPLRLFLTEVTSDYKDVNQCAIEFFKKNANKDDTIFANYGDLPLMFYTDLQVYGGLQGRVPPPDRLPDWVLVRPFFGLARTGCLFRSDDFLRKNVNLEKDYEKITLDCPAEMWGARPDPYNHRFTPVPEPYTRLAVYRKRRAGR